jgi:hypothetical protein
MNPSDSKGRSPFSRFQALAKTLCSVPKSEVDKLREREAKAKKGKPKSDK